MKKRLIKILAVVSATLLALSLTACDPRVKIEPRPNPRPNPWPRPYPYDDVKTSIYVSNYEGGYGRVWLDNAIDRFEEKYQNYEFEPGSRKKGVRIYVDSSINGKTGEEFIKYAKNSDYHVIFTEDTFYYDLVNKYGAGADISDIVNAPLNGEFWDDFNQQPKSIASKMPSEVQNFFGVKPPEGTKYYALPHYFDCTALYYDIDLFDNFGFWLKEDGTLLGEEPSYKRAVAWGEADKNDYPLSKGIDGDNGAEFDGLPATYDEFFKLLDYMIERGVDPIHTYGGGGPVDGYLYNAWAQNEGRQSFTKLFKPTGVSNRLIDSVDEDGNITMLPSDTQVDGKNIQAQLGKYQAVQLGKRLAQGDFDVPYYFYDEAFAPCLSSVLAEGTYLNSSYEEMPIAMYMGRIAWENQATESLWFEDAPCGRYDRRFGVLPVPFADESYLDGNQKWTIVSDCNLSLSFINANLQEDPNKAGVLDAAKKFLQFLHTDEELQNFSVQTSGFKPFNYPITYENKAYMSCYGEQVLSLTNNPNVDIVYTFTNAEHYLDNYAYYYPTDIGWGGYSIITEFFNKPDKTAVELFFEIKTAKNSAWDSSLEKTE